MQLSNGITPRFRLFGFIHAWPGGVSEIVSAPFPCGRNIYDAISKNGATAYGFKWSYKVAINDIR